MKKITIAKARKLDKEIGNVLNSQFKTHYKISKFKQHSELLDEYAENLSEFNSHYSQILNLTRYKFDLRALIQHSNSTTDINNLLNLKQRLTAQLTIVTNILYSIADSYEASEFEIAVISGKMKKDTDNSYHSSDTVSYIVADKTMHEDMEKSVVFFKGEISGIDDELLRLNNHYTIDVEDDKIDLLGQFAIVV